MRQFCYSKLSTSNSTSTSTSKYRRVVVLVIVGIVLYDKLINEEVSGARRLAPLLETSHFCGRIRKRENRSQWKTRNNLVCRGQSPRRKQRGQKKNAQKRPAPPVFQSALLQWLENKLSFKESMWNAFFSGM